MVMSSVSGSAADIPQQKVKRYDELTDHGRLHLGDAGSTASFPCAKAA